MFKINERHLNHTIELDVTDSLAETIVPGDVLVQRESGLFTKGRTGDSLGEYDAGLYYLSNDFYENVHLATIHTSDGFVSQRGLIAAVPITDIFEFEMDMYYGVMKGEGLGIVDGQLTMGISVPQPIVVFAHVKEDNQWGNHAPKGTARFTTAISRYVFGAVALYIKDNLYPEDGMIDYQLGFNAYGAEFDPVESANEANWSIAINSVGALGLKFPGITFVDDPVSPYVVFNLDGQALAGDQILISAKKEAFIDVPNGSIETDTWVNDWQHEFIPDEPSEFYNLESLEAHLPYNGDYEGQAGVFQLGAYDDTPGSETLALDPIHASSYQISGDVEMENVSLDIIILATDEPNDVTGETVAGVDNIVLTIGTGGNLIKNMDDGCQATLRCTVEDGEGGQTLLIGTYTVTDVTFDGGAGDVVDFTVSLPPISGDVIPDHDPVSVVNVDYISTGTYKKTMIPLA